MNICFNWDFINNTCKVLFQKNCPGKECSSFCYSALDYLNNLEQRLHYAEKKQSKATIRALNQEIKEFKLVHGEQISQEVELRLQFQGDGWESAYYEDLHRGSGGGGSEQDSNSKTSEKQKMKDNRSQNCKLTKVQRDEIKKVTQEFEEANDIKLPRLSRSMMSHSRIDSYTGAVSCSYQSSTITPNTCEGKILSNGSLAKICQTCVGLDSTRLKAKEHEHLENSPKGL